MPHSCVVLLSGGLDSLLVLRLMVNQGIRATALHSVNCFHGVADIEEKKRKIRDKALELGAADVVFPTLSADVVALTKHPRWGYGKHLNACIDCRLRTVREGFAHMRAIGADFVVSGEVVGQRPMSQRRDAMRLADKEIAAWGFEGLFLRPLSAKLLAATIPAEKGWITQDCLYDISGRGRDRQMALAEELNIGEFPSPGGGCLLTDPGFSWRLAVLFQFTPDWDASDVELLKVGRHFQVAPTSRIVVSRREEENYRLRELSRPTDRLYINKERNGAVVLLRGQRDAACEALAGGLAVHYSKMREAGKATVESWRIESGEDTDFQSFTAETTDPDITRTMERALAGADLVKRLRRQASHTPS